MNDTTESLQPRLLLLLATDLTARCDRPLDRGRRIRVASGQGLVTEAVSRHVVEEAIDLVVVGVHRQSAVARVFKGSTREDLLQQVPCDMLLVRASEDSDDG